MNWNEFAHQAVLHCNRYTRSLLAAGLGLFFASMDCDLTLWFYSRFGRSSKSLSGKVVWITGSSAGIGESLAHRLAASGCKLVLCGTRSHRLENVKKRCHEINKSLEDRDILTLQFDMKDTEKMPQLVEQVVQHFGRVDVLVNNAGRTQRALFERTDLKVDRDMFDVNVFGLIHLTRVVVQLWYSTGISGHVVVTSSIAGKVGAPFSSSYTASKHALHGYMESLRMESYSRGVRVTMVCPGPVVSEIIDRAYTEALDKKWGGSHRNDKKRMPTDRCAHLMSVAMANRLDEVWIAQQPFLLMYYAQQYLPSLTRTLFPLIMTKERIMRLRDGEDQLK